MIANNTIQVREAVRNFINSSINIDSLGDDENLFESGIVNSLFAVQLTTFVERQFRIEVSMEDLDIENFRSVNATTAFVMRKSGDKGGKADPGAEADRQQAP